MIGKRRFEPICVKLLLFAGLVLVTVWTFQPNLVWSPLTAPEQLQSESEFLHTPTPPRDPLENFRIVTAFSDNHFNEALTSCETAGRLADVAAQPPGFMIAYLLGPISDTKLAQYRRRCAFVDIRIFDWSRFPAFLNRIIYSCAWKPLIVHDVIGTVDALMWVDTSIKFSGNATDTITSLVQEMEPSFSTCDYRLFSTTHHSVLAATHPATLQHFDISPEAAKQVEMREAGLFILRKSPHSLAILKGLVACSLQEGCVAPSGAKTKCNLTKLRANKYAGCHRFDQSVLNLHLMKCSNNSTRYFKKTDLLSVRRGQ